MICAWILKPADELKATDRLEVACSAWKNEGALIWVDAEAPRAGGLTTLQSVFDLDPATFIDCELCEHRPEVQETRNRVFLLCYPLAQDSAPGGSELDETGLAVGKLRIYCGERFILTVHPAAVAPVSQLVQGNRVALKEALEQGAEFLLYRFIDGLITDYFDRGEAYQTQLEALEDESLMAQAEPSILQRLSRLRGLNSELDQLARRQREALQPMLKGRYRFPSKRMLPLLDHSEQHLQNLCDITSVNRDLIRTTRDNYNATLSNRMNHIMRILTVFASILLPLSLIAGIYGMNLPLWPSPDEPSSLIWVVAAMAVTALVLIAFFWRKKWL